MTAKRPELPSSQPIVAGRDLAVGFEEQCDVVIVGSGAGGATVAAHLAEAGLSVILLEEGPHVPPEQYQRFKPSETVRRMFREAGMTIAVGDRQTPIIAIAVGRNVGGSSVLTGGVCFRVPSDVHARWERDLGLQALSERALADAYADVEQRLGVTVVSDALRSESTLAFLRGAAELGIPMHSLRRNMGAECKGLSRCNFGCPVGAKRSVDVSYLPSAFANGARLVADALVERVLVEGGRAVGVVGRLIGGDDRRLGHSFRVRARAVVVACGTLHTPLLLRASGLRSDFVGRGVTLHPGGRVAALFREPLRGWNGALQSVYSDHFADDGIKLVGVFSPVNILAAGMPGVGPSFDDGVRKMAHLAAFGAMIHDEGGGRVRRGPGREPLLSYRMVPRDLARLRRSFRILADIALAAGAEQVIVPIFGWPAVRTAEDAKALETASFDPRRIECFAFHPLGSARMGRMPRAGVVDQDGESFEVPGLFVADGSIIPSSIGVNSQVAIMAVATSIAWRLRERLGLKMARQLGARRAI